MDEKDPLSNADGNEQPKKLYSPLPQGSMEEVNVTDDEDPYREIDTGQNEKPGWSVVGIDRRVELGISICIALFALFQLLNSISSSQSSSRQIQQLICAAEKNASAADKFRIAAEGINRHVSDAVSELSDQASASETQAQASLRSAKAQEIANRTVADQFALTERPWVQVDTNMSIYQGPVWVATDASGKPIIKQPRELMDDPNDMILGNFPMIISATFSNVGHSPGLNESQNTRADFVLPTGFLPNFTDTKFPAVTGCDKNAKRVKSEFVVFGGKTYHTKIADMIAPAGEVKDFNASRRILVTQGCIKYDDEVGNPHQTNFCSYLSLSAANRQWETCSSGNSAW
jgi:hypothetical protein